MMGAIEKEVYAGARRSPCWPQLCGIDFDNRLSSVKVDSACRLEVLCVELPVGAIVSCTCSTKFKRLCPSMQSNIEGVAANYRKVAAQKIREKSLCKVVGGQITPPREIFCGLLVFSPVSA